jgi:glycosyltransferase involved in cell wall biosynthesis
VRLYYKIARSLAKIADVWLISCSGVRNDAVNPYQVIVDAESSHAALHLIYKEALKVKPNVVICVEPLTMFIGIALRRKCDARIIFDVHEFYPDAFAERFPQLLGWLMKWPYLLVERWLQKHADATIAVNDKILDQLVPKHSRDFAVTIPNYPVRNVWDYTCEMPAEISTICEMTFDLVYIGGLTKDRGIMRLLESLSILRGDFPRLNILILGRFHDPAVEKEFNDAIITRNLSAMIYYQNWLPAEKIGLLLKRSRVGLWIFNPARARMRRAVPLKVLEYFAAGLPVVSIDTPIMRDLVKKHDLGRLCEYRAQSIAKAIASILRLSDANYSAMSKRASDLIDTSFNWEALEPLLFSVITKVTHCHKR